MFGKFSGIIKIYREKSLPIIIGLLFFTAFSLPLLGAEAQDSGTAKNKGMQSMPKQMQDGAGKAGKKSGMKMPMMGGGAMAKYNKV